MKNRMKILTTLVCMVCCFNLSYADDGLSWDIINKSMSAWNVDGGTDQDKAWALTKTYLTATQREGYVNIYKVSGADGFLNPSAYPTTNKTGIYTIDIKARVNAIDKEDTATAFEANQITIAVGGKKMKIYLKHGDDNNGYLCYTTAATHEEDEKYIMNTADWHIYRFVYYPSDYTYDVYIDNAPEPAFSRLKTHYDGSKNYVMIGSDKDHYCNMDIEYVKFGTGNYSLKPQINNVQVGSDSHVVNNAHTIQLTINTDLIEDGQQVFVALYNEVDEEQTTPMELTVTGNQVTTNFAMPASLPKGKYTLKAFVEGDKIGELEVKPKTKDYFIVDESPITTKMLPQVEPVGFIIETDDYLFPALTNEYVFPTVVDAEAYLNGDGTFSDGTKPIDRYYWIHTPHDDPGGMFLYTGPTLDGPWTENGMILTNDWARENGINTSHISSAHVIWNDIYNKYFMYFHGNNDRTQYATSDNLIDWTYGGQAVQYDDFSFSSREASYAKVFEYEVPGYNNKYVMMLMVNENDARTIYWAHSADGMKWKGVRKPLVTPKTSYKVVPGTTTKPNYSNNVSGPFFMIVEDRYFVLFHSTAGSIAVVEIGEKFDMEVHWGTYLNKNDVIINKDESGVMKAVERVASPFFIQDDLGTWYLFFEAGHRLGANTAYAKGETPDPVPGPCDPGGECYPCGEGGPCDPDPDPCEPGGECYPCEEGGPCDVPLPCNPDDPDNPCDPDPCEPGGECYPCEDPDDPCGSVSIGKQLNEKADKVNLYKSAGDYILKNQSRETGLYKVFNSTGILVKEDVLLPGENNLDLKTGLYIIQVELGGNNSVLKAF